MSKRHRKVRSSTSKPVVDIVMPVFGEPVFLRDCLHSLWHHEAGVPYTLTLVDDESPESHELMPVYEEAKGKGATVVFHKKNQGFAATCNTGASKGKAPYVLLLNSDMLVIHDGWLKAMTDEAKNSKVGVVGALLTFFSDRTDDLAGMTQHAGVVFDILGRPYHIFSGWSPDNEKVNRRREMNCVTGACFLARRTLWRRFGGLDTDYTRGNFEDVQFCLQCKLAGFKVVYTPKAHLRHFAGGSGNSMTADRNARLFQLKMGKVVEYDEWRYW